MSGQRPGALYLLGLAPLLAAPPGPAGGLLLGLATLLAALGAGLAMAPLRRRLPAPLHWLGAALLIATVTAALGLLARALAWDWQREVAPLLPLLVGNSLLVAVVAGERGEPLLRQALLCGGVMAAALTGAGLLRGVLPGDSLGVTALLGAGLLVALVRAWRPQPPPPAPPGDPARRVRVTGPVR